jgi:hypothetical protein
MNSAQLDAILAGLARAEARLDAVAGPAVVSVTIECSDTDFLPALVRFFQIIRDVAAGGHSFEVTADQEQSSDYKDGPPRFSIDGDGSDRIYRILVNGKDAGRAEKFRK